MTDDDLADRLDAVERRLDAAYPEPEDRVDPERVESLAERLADVEAAVEAVEGYVGHVERVDDDLEQRANAALAAVDDLQPRVAALEGDASPRPPDRTGSTNPGIDAGAEAGFAAAAAGAADPADAVAHPADAVADPADDVAVPAADVSEHANDRSAPTDDRTVRRDDPAASACVESERTPAPGTRTPGPATEEPLEGQTDAARADRPDSTDHRSIPSDRAGRTDRCPACETPRSAGSPATATSEPDASGRPVSGWDADARVANAPGADAASPTVDEATSSTGTEATRPPVDDADEATAWPSDDSHASRPAASPNERTGPTDRAAPDRREPKQRESRQRESTGGTGSRAADPGSRASAAVEPWTERGTDAQSAELDAPARDDRPGETLYERLRAML